MPPANCSRTRGRATPYTSPRCSASHRGAGAPTAQLATDMGIPVFRLAYERWVADGDGHFTEPVRESAYELWTVASDTAR